MLQNYKSYNIAHPLSENPHHLDSYEPLDLCDPMTPPHQVKIQIASEHDNNDRFQRTLAECKLRLNTTAAVKPQRPFKPMEPTPCSKPGSKAHGDNYDPDVWRAPTPRWVQLSTSHLQRYLVINESLLEFSWYP